MAPRSGRNGAEGHPSAAVSAAVELLEVLRARGQDAAGAAVSPSQLRALLVVETAEGINLRTLGAVLGSRPPSVTRLCDRMAAMGLVERMPSRTSRREVELRLTPQGRALLEEQRSIRLLEMAAVLDRMEPAAVEALVVGLRGFRDAADARFAPGPATAADAREGPSVVGKDN
ncbi:MarR family transcriptional regulator [Streptomyces sp. NPDC058674]|uniref:MarR family transcriptional regulator n=1 Tax=Streptomyces sp. NPDC058674 TaxID=3346592 RepID=UPI0036517F24